MHGRNTKAVFLGLLALAGAMAASASSAHADWLFLKNGMSVSTITRLISSSEDFSLLVSNGIRIDCTASEGSASVSLSEGNKKASGAISVTLKGCEEANFGEVCETHSAGQADGTILVSLTGVGGMVSAEEDYLLSASKNEKITTILFTGEECPLVEVDGTLTCHWKETYLSALKDENLHVLHIGETNIEVGQEEAEIDNETGGFLILGSTKESTGATFALHLVNL